MLLDPTPSVVDEMHVIDARGTGRHAGQAGEATVDMLDSISADAARGKHVFDQVYTTARTIELVAQENISRAGCRAEPAMSAGTQYLFGFRNVGIGELLRREIGSHLLTTPRPFARD
jgi:hypothetical protein